MAVEIPVDQSRFAALISAGSTVEPIQKFDREAPKDAPRVQETDKRTGQLLWRATVFVPGEDGAKAEKIDVKIAQSYEPVMGGFGECVEFENLTAVPYIEKGGPDRWDQIKLSYKATGIVKHGTAKVA